MIFSDIQAALTESAKHILKHSQTQSTIYIITRKPNSQTQAHTHLHNHAHKQPTHTLTSHNQTQTHTYNHL